MPDKLKIAILGTRGIPNRYGGFEECAEKLSVRLASKGHQVAVYTDAAHPVREKQWKGVERILKENPEHWMGTAGQFFYDLRCNLNSRHRAFDIILHLGYTSDSVWQQLWPSESVHIVNMDGLEWQRSKYSRPVRGFLKYAEKLAAKKADWLVADSLPIMEYLEKNYNKPIRHIAYGADIPETIDEKVPSEFGLINRDYDLIVARIIPDNNIEMILKAREKGKDRTPLMILCNRNRMMNELKEKYSHLDFINFHGPVYEKSKVSSLRFHCRYYIHGHSAGGTNPSLLEAMACSSPVIAHDNPFNRAVLGPDAQYFGSAEALADILEGNPREDINKHIQNNLQKVKDVYNWDAISHAYEKLFYESLDKH